MPPQTCYTCSLAGFYDNAPDLLVRILLFGIGYYGFLQYTISSLMAVNRFTAVHFPMVHARMWDKALVPAILTTLLYPFTFQWEFLAYAGYIVKNNATRAYNYKSDAPSPAPLRTVSIFVVNFGTFLLNIGLNSSVLYKVLCHRSRLFKQKNGHLEMSLALHNFTTFCGEAFTSLVTFMLLFREVPEMYTAAVALIPYSCDAVSLLSPYFLLLCSGDLRRRLFGFFNSPESSSVAVVNSVN